MKVQRPASAPWVCVVCVCERASVRVCLFVLGVFRSSRRPAWAWPAGRFRLRLRARCLRRPWLLRVRHDDDALLHV